MNIKLFNSGSIIAPLKCGTRELENTFGQPDAISTHIIKRKISIEGVKTIIVRPPDEHLKSALHTEIISLIRSNYLKTDTKELSNFIKGFFKSGSSHWNPDIYEYLYKFWNRNNYIEIVELKNLSKFIYTLTKKKIIHKPNDWNFSSNQKKQYWISSNSLWDWVEQEFEDDVNDLLISKINKEMDWYNKLIKKEKTIFIPKLI
jgi:hypothetical protein